MLTQTAGKITLPYLEWKVRGELYSSRRQEGSWQMERRGMKEREGSQKKIRLPFVSFLLAAFFSFIYLFI